MQLNTDLNLKAPDDFYQMVVDAHRDLAPEQSRLLNAKLILLLANHIGDEEVLTSAVVAARAGIAPTTTGPDVRITA